VLNVVRGVTSSDTRDVSEHGLVQGDRISSPTAFIRFSVVIGDSDGIDRRCEHDPDAEIAWEGTVPFWLEHLVCLYRSGRIECHGGINFIKNNLQTNAFNDRNALRELDSF